jgi:hypothetical protein
MRKNGEEYVVNFACAKCRRIGILRNLTDMRWKASAGFGLRMERVPLAYHRLLISVSAFSRIMMILLSNSMLRYTKDYIIDPLQ